MRTVHQETSDEENEKPRTKKKQKKDRDPDMPKKPIGAFFMYSKVVLKERMKDYPKLSHKEVQKIVGEEFKALSDQDKLACFLILLQSYFAD